MQGGDVPLDNMRLMVSLPPSTRYLPGSSVLDNRVIADPEVRGNVLVYNLGEVTGTWAKQLNFLAEKEFIFRFNKNAAAADINHQAFMVFVMAFKKNRLNIGPAGILAGISPCLKSAIS